MSMCINGIWIPWTNADRIRAMSDKELAEWLVHVEKSILEKQPTLDRSELYTDWLNWLQQEVCND